VTDDEEEQQMLETFGEKYQGMGLYKLKLSDIVMMYC